MRLIWLVSGIVLLISIEVLRIYFIMPFPGSQEDETIHVAYFIFLNTIYFRLAGLMLVAYPLLQVIKKGSIVARITLIAFTGMYFFIFYQSNYVLSADHMFLELRKKEFSTIENNVVDTKQLVLGLVIGKESKAYPIEIIGYHHQVRDSVGDEPVMITYCTVCRTGRIYSPVIDSKAERFRLVGMDHYNAMFEDHTTKSWWRQVTGEAIEGPMKGRKLTEIMSEQVSLAAWINMHPQTRILQPDKTFADRYDKLKNYDEGLSLGRLERKDIAAWSDKSWIVGIQIGMEAKAYDWNDLLRMKLISDQIDGTPIVLVVHPDSVSFHAYSRMAGKETLDFILAGDGSGFSDSRTGSVWNWDGLCQSGLYQKENLIPVQAYQEYWHSWRTFHPQTSRFIPDID